MSDVVQLIMDANPELAEELLNKGLVEVVRRIGGSTFKPFVKCPVTLFNPQQDPIAEKILETAQSILEARPDLSGTVGNLKALSSLNLGLNIANLILSGVEFAYLQSEINELNTRIQNVEARVVRLERHDRNNTFDKCLSLNSKFQRYMESAQYYGLCLVAFPTDLLDDMDIYLFRLVDDISRGEWDHDLDTFLNLALALFGYFSLLWSYYSKRFFQERRQLPTLNHHTYDSICEAMLRQPFINKIAQYYVLGKGLNVSEMYEEVSAWKQTVEHYRDTMRNVGTLMEAFLGDESGRYEKLCNIMNKYVRDKVASLASETANICGITSKECFSVLEERFLGNPLC